MLLSKMEFTELFSHTEKEEMNENNIFFLFFISKVYFSTLITKL